MSFSSFNYILLFLPSVFVLFWSARKLPVPKAPQICILLASLFFYAYHSPAHLAYLLGSIIANWLLGRWLGSAAESSRKPICVLGIVLNIAYLCTFKYVNFFCSNIPYFGTHHIHIPDLPFPLGISFFTLAQIIYLIQCYEEVLLPSSLFDHATYVSFFPYVISGPISRPDRILHQVPAWNDTKGPAADDIARALFLFSMGLVKKVVIADAFSQAADYGFDKAHDLSTIEAWFFLICYTLQIYFDFSGYSDMAIASARLFGIEIQRNFDVPLRSQSVIEFWTRWHISLSQFITSYLYTPILLAMPRVTLLTSSIATFIAMTVAGLWHGPAWTFVMYGIVYGVALTCNQYWRKKKMPQLPAFPSWLLTMVVVEVAMLFFRSASLRAALLYLPHLVSWRNVLGTGNIHAMNSGGFMFGIYLIAQIVGVVLAFVGKSSEQLAREFKPSGATATMTAGFTLVAWLFMNSNIAKPFIYFAF